MTTVGQLANNSSSAPTDLTGASFIAGGGRLMGLVIGGFLTVRIAVALLHLG
jgi:hypothetical protein